MQTQPLTASLLAGHNLLAVAFSRACLAHAAQVRKGTTVPYVSHLLQVAGLVLEFGGSMDQAVAGVLHDAVEDTNLTLEDIRREFWPHIADMVSACTDTDVQADVIGHDPAEIGLTPPTAAKLKAPWMARKAQFLEKLRNVTPDAALVIACDKLHNLRCQISDMTFGTGTVKFNASYKDRQWLQSETLEALRGKVPPRLFVELAAATREWETCHDFARCDAGDARVRA